MAKNIEQTVKDLMAVILNLDPGKIDDNAAMGVTPGWDSANHINLILALEEEFSISFDVSEFELMVTFYDVIQMVEAKV